MAAPVPVPVPAWFFFSLATLGALYTAAAGVRLLAHLALCLRRPKDLPRSYGAWAVVTGPTSGIGRSMAMELARAGLNLVLVGRDPAKLRDVAEAFTSTNHAAVQIKTVVFDLSLVSAAERDEALRRLRDAVAGLDVGVLVNNAGVAKPGAAYLHEADVEAWVRMIRVNVLALTEVTAAVMPGMAARGRGTVVNVGSGSTLALPSFPLYSVYAGTKRYVTAFSRSLAVEYGGTGVDVQCQVPFMVETNMVSSAVRRSFSRWFLLAPEAYARAAVAWIGHGVVCVPSAAHQLQWWSISGLPECVLDAYRLRKHLQQRAVFRRLTPWRNQKSKM